MWVVAGSLRLIERYPTRSQKRGRPVNTYIVSYDLRQPGQKYAAVAEYLKSFGTHSKVLESFWVVVTDKTAVQIREDLKAIVDDGDGIFVVKSGGEAAWVNVKSSTDWLKNNL